MRVSFHFLVLIDITKSLKMGLMLRVGEKDATKIFSKYEKLGNICFLCGCLDHLMKECDKREKDFFL